MCINPNRLNNGILVGCRKCWQCRNKAVHDWTGRCIAETKTSVKSHYITLTYGYDDRMGSTDHLHARVLHYQDVQLFIKNMRRNFPFRYFCVGEYGHERGRAHWHILIFWQKEVPDLKLYTERWTWEHWPHGFTWAENMGFKAIRYCCKYMYKDQDDPSKQAYLAMSKKPELGNPYFRQLALKHVEQGLAPQDLLYSFPELRKPGRKPIPHKLHTAAARNFLDAFIELWEEQRPGEPIPASALVEERFDARERERATATFDWAAEYRRVRDKPRLYKAARPWRKPPGWDDYSYQHLQIPFDELGNCYWVWYIDRRYFWKLNKDGEWAWTSKKGDGGNGGANENRRLPYDRPDQNKRSA